MSRPRASSQPGKISFFLSPNASTGLRPRAVSSRPGSMLEEELSCPVCCEVFRDPVVLKCTHSFCRACLQEFWNKKKARRECPVCRMKCSLTEPTVSLALKNVADTFTREQQQQQQASLNRASGMAGPEVGRFEVKCSTHGEYLKLFCLDDTEVLCCVCHTSKKHYGHRVCPLEEGAQDLKVELKKELIPMKKSLRSLYETKQECDDTTVHIKNQTQSTERQIRAEFDELRQFLQKEEDARIALLHVEEEAKKQLVIKKADNITRDILSLSMAIVAIENDIASGDAIFLQNYNSTKKRAQISPSDPETFPAGALINEAKHICSLKYQVWEKMLGLVQYTPVTLDPNTAYSWLTLSKDLTSVSNSGAVHQLPKNPERFDHFVFALGSEGFTSGRHAWEVEVGDKEDWMMGVVKGSVNRKGPISGCPEGGFWMMSHCEGDYTAMTRPSTPLVLAGGLHRVRVQLDYDSGEVSFSNPVSMTSIYTFHDFFTEKLFPFFCPGANINGNNPGPLKICPVKVAVWNSATW